jgi:hypothetical protein
MNILRYFPAGEEEEQNRKKMKKKDWNRKLGTIGFTL